MNPSTILHFRDIPDDTLRYFRSGRSNAASIYDTIEHVYGAIYSSYPYDVQVGLAPPSPTHNSGVTYGDLLEAKRIVASYNNMTLEDYLADERLVSSIPMAPPAFLPAFSTTGVATLSPRLTPMDIDSPRLTPFNLATAYTGAMATTAATTGGAVPMEDDEPMPFDYDSKEPEEPFLNPPTYVDFEYGVGTFLYRASEVIRSRGFASLSAFWATIREGDSVTYMDEDGTAFTYSYEAVHRSDNSGNHVSSDNYRGFYMEGFF